MMAALRFDDSQKAKRIEILGIFSQDELVEPPGLGEIAVLVMHHGFAERIAEHTRRLRATPK
jgi:hypothetical protein